MPLKLFFGYVTESLETVLFSNFHLSKPPFKIETLSEENKLNEYLLTSIRTSNGVNKNFINKNFNSKLISLLKRKLKNIPREFILENENNIKLTNRGKCFADKITRDLFY